MPGVLASPYLMPSGHTVGENHAYMLRQLLALQRRKRGTRQATAVKIRREKIGRQPSDFFVSRQSTAVWSPSFPCSSRPICPAMPRGEISEIEPHPPCVYMHVLSGSVRER